MELFGEMRAHSGLKIILKRIDKKRILQAHYNRKDMRSACYTTKRRRDSASCGCIGLLSSRFPRTTKHTIPKTQKLSIDLMVEVDRDFYGRGLDAVFGPGAEVRNKRECALKLLGRGEARKGDPIREISDYDLYGRVC